MPDQLEGMVGETFIKDRHGIKTKVILCQVLRTKVVVMCPDRQDKFKLPIAEFNKKYKAEASLTA